MKKAINIWSFFGPWNLEEKCKIAAEAGFSGIEIDLTEDGPVDFKKSGKELADVRKTAEAAGLEPTGLACALYWGANAASADEQNRKKADEILSRQIECAAALGLDSILVIPGTVGADFIPDCEIVPYADAWDRARAFIERALPQAGKAGVTICIENVWNKFLISPLEMKQFIDSFSSDAVAAYFDVGNALGVGYPEHWIPILGERIKRVHFKDYRINVGSVDGFCDLLSGDVNWPAVVGELRKIGYKDWVAPEMIPPLPFYKHCPEVLIHNSYRALDSILKLR